MRKRLLIDSRQWKWWGIPAGEPIDSPVREIRWWKRYVIWTLSLDTPWNQPFLGWCNDYYSDASLFETEMGKIITAVGVDLFKNELRHQMGCINHKVFAFIRLNSGVTKCKLVCTTRNISHSQVKVLDSWFTIVFYSFLHLQQLWVEVGSWLGIIIIMFPRNSFHRKE